MRALQKKEKEIHPEKQGDASAAVLTTLIQIRSADPAAAPVHIQLRLGSLRDPSQQRWMTHSELQTGRTQPRHHWVRAE